jgi:hypothetical protein
MTVEPDSGRRQGWSFGFSFELDERVLPHRTLSVLHTLSYPKPAHSELLGCPAQQIKRALVVWGACLPNAYTVDALGSCRSNAA